MRNVLSLSFFAAAVALSTALQAQTIPNEQHSIITKISATWCPPCGGWGWDLFDGLIHDNADNNGVFIAAHYSGDLVTTTANELADNFGVTGQPQFYLGSDRIQVSSGTAITKRAEVTDQLATLANATPLANATVSGSLDGDVLSATVNGKFFSAADGEYYAAVLVLEDNVINNQANRGSMANHLRVLRGTVGLTSAFGQRITNGPVSADHTFTLSLSGAAPTISNIENVTLAVVLWEKVGDRYVFVNVNDVADWQSNSSRVEELSQQAFAFSSFSESGTLTTRLDIGLSAKRASLQLIDAQGRLLETQGLGELTPGYREITWQTSSLAAGYYAVRLQTEQGSRSEAVVIPR